MHGLEQKLPVYDIANVGPRNRFMVRTSSGPMLVHNCILGLGYGVGASKLQYSLKNGLVRVDLPIEECERIVKLYRSTYSAIPALWKSCQRGLDTVYDHFDCMIGVGTELLFAGNRELFFPNGMSLKYPDLDRTPGVYGWEYTYQNRRFRKKIYGGALTENIIQGLARIIVCYQMCRIRQLLNAKAKEADDGKIRRVVHMVHDEVVVVVPEDEAEWTQAMMESVMRKSPKWATGLPLNCEAGVGDNYGQAK